MRARRRAVDAVCRAEASRRVCERLLACVGAGATVAVYLATAEELDLDDFIARTTARRVAPRWDAVSRTYGLAELTDAGTVPGHWGIREPLGAAVPPAAVDVWIVPGLAFTRDGKRLGYGGGYYDRFLAAARPDARKLGVAYPFQILSDLPTDAHDARLDAVVS